MTDIYPQRGGAQLRHLGRGYAGKQKGANDGAPAGPRSRRTLTSGNGDSRRTIPNRENTTIPPTTLVRVPSGVNPLGGARYVGPSSPNSPLDWNGY